MSVTETQNVDTGEVRTYTLDARSAVIAAHAQSRKDWSTWSYESRYSGLVHRIEDRMGIRFICGSWWAKEQ